MNRALRNQAGWFWVTQRFCRKLRFYEERKRLPKALKDWVVEVFIRELNPKTSTSLYKWKKSWRISKPKLGAKYASSMSPDPTWRRTTAELIRGWWEYRSVSQMTWAILKSKKMNVIIGGKEVSRIIIFVSKKPKYQSVIKKRSQMEQDHVKMIVFNEQDLDFPKLPQWRLVISLNFANFNV